MTSETLELIERDDAGNITTTYIESAASEGRSRVDAVLPKASKSYAQQLLDVFLPVGYPHSDSLQAFSSSIAGLLSSRAVLEARTPGYRLLPHVRTFRSRRISKPLARKPDHPCLGKRPVEGVGVGDASASPTAALLLSVLQESMGRIATILFAHRLGTSLEPECKMYRLAADVFNDTAMVLDCLSPAFPKSARVLILSFSSVLRSLCGVCAGSSKASLSAHFARRGNLGELNAKDSSQETVISLLGMLAGSFVVSWVSTPMATWTMLVALLSTHLATNYAAVKSVSMRSLNRQRANILLSKLLQDGRILSPPEVSTRERIFERDGVLRWTDDSILGHCRIGVSLENLISQTGQRHRRSGSLHMQAIKLSDIVRLYQDEGYLLWSCGSNAMIVLKQDCTPTDQLKAWTQALLLARRRTQDSKPKDGEHDTSGALLAELRSALEEAQKLFNTYESQLRDAGWDLDVAVLETRPGVRIQIETK
ncbi:DUF647-domain-containing protein [Bimuria novae-zelandiae CBS 107.79]|uniref:DUF647-domain-containing protein n=1 Tax=Bimuria novae-zelandiae CBS 107.79 TaxID=1447943 RepID=A0A6A5VB29_9PLEO|nr:DUF647-domain-containing protein [Bimuria novae-zelandiae CBS 107.79]